MSIKLSSQKKLKDKKRKEPITYYELVELENQRNNPPPPKVKIIRKFPIAPDGFVPNSVVKKFFDMFDPDPEEIAAAPVIWRLNWRPTDIAEENTSGRGSVEGKVLEYDWDEQEVSSEGENVEDVEEEIKQEEPERLLLDLVDRLSDLPWFEITTENLNIPYLLRYLFSKLIERNPDDHLIITQFICEINEKFKVNEETREWVIQQLEEELDATDEDIIRNNLSLVESFGSETYRVDVGLVNLLKKEELSEELRAQARRVLISVSKTDDERIEFVLENIKKIYNSRYKKEDASFVLNEFIEDIKAEIAEHLEVTNDALDITKNSEIFKTILKEDWIATSIKENFKSLEDFLEYFIKYLKTAKSKIFYEKVANFLSSLYHEFNLANSDWEIQIIEHFVNNNTDPKVAESLRLIDLNHLGKYYPILKDPKQRHQILIELLRSACFEKTRKLVMKTSEKMLRDLTSFSDDFMTSLLDFYSSKKFATVTILSWSETLDLLKNKPAITTEEILTMKDLDPSILVAKAVETVEINKPIKHNKHRKKGKHHKKDKEKDPKAGGPKKDKKEKKLSKGEKETKKEKETGNIEQRPVDNPVSILQLKFPQARNDSDMRFDTTNRRLLNLSIQRYFRVDLVRRKSNTTQAKANGTRQRINLLQQRKSNAEPFQQNQPEQQMIYEKPYRISDKEPTIDDTPDDNLVSSQSRRPVICDTINSSDKLNNDQYVKINDLATDQTSILSGQDNDLLTPKALTQVRIPSPVEPSYFFKNRSANEAPIKIANNHANSDLDHIPAPKSSIQQINGDFLSMNINRDDTLPSQSIKTSTANHFNPELTDQFLAGITKRVVFFENRLKDLTSKLSTLKTFTIFEKCHLIDQNEINDVQESNFKFESFRHNRRSREDEFNKLLQCLIIRGLDLHRHYERICPRGNSARREDSPVQALHFYNDFLVVHPYNLKNMSGRHRSYHQSKRNALQESMRMSGFLTEQDRSRFSGYTGRGYRPNPLGGNRPKGPGGWGIAEARPDESELNHIFLINKLLVSYGAQNLRKFYTSINSDFKSYLHRLHSRIPHRIVPLIWNDPVIQKIAMIISSTRQFQTMQQIACNPVVETMRPDSPGLAELKSKLNVKSRPGSAANTGFVRRNFEVGKYNIVSGYCLEDEAVDKVPANLLTRTGTGNGITLNLNNTTPLKESYEYWPLFKQENTPQNKVAKQKLYSHLVNMKNEYVKLQWRYMLQDEKNRKTRSYLPPLSYKVPLNKLPQHQHGQSNQHSES